MLSSLLHVPSIGRNPGFAGFRRTFLLFIAALSAVLAAQPTMAAGLLVADGGFGGALDIVEHDVKVTINNGIAVTEITQVFRNRENRIVEALYTFPVPEGGSVADFSMWIQGNEMVGEVLEKKRAREIYESYKQTRQDPGLLEQVNYKSFEMRIFPIAAQAEQRVRITYYQELSFDNDWATFVFPLATETRQDMQSRTTGRFGLDLQVKSEIPIVAMESPSHPDDFAIASHAAHFWQASFEVTEGDLNRDLVIAFQQSRPRTGLDLIASREAGEDGYFMLTLTAGDELEGLNDGMDYVFVLDVSGSMNKDGKLNLSRNSLNAFVEALGDEDRFELISFNATAEPLFRSLQSPTSDQRTAATEFLGSRAAKGGTFLEPAVQAAYRYKAIDRTLNVVILSDGMTEQTERAALLRLARDRPADSRTFAIGVGNEVDRPLLRQLAEDAGGLAAFVSRGDDFDRQAAAFRRKLVQPVATNLTLDLAGGDVYDLEPATLPNLFHGKPVRLYGRYRGAGPVTVRVGGTVGGEELAQEVEMALPERQENPELERMWAYRRVQSLLAAADRKGSRDRAIDEIVRLGELYSIASEYTSFIVLENDGEYRRWKIERRNARRLARDRQHLTRLRQQLDALRGEAAAGLGPVDAEKEAQLAANQPAQARPSSSPARAPQPVPDSSRGRDLDFGGGAFDPITATFAAGLAASALAGRRRKKQE